MLAMIERLCGHPDGCARPHEAKGLCQGHYRHALRHDGDPGPAQLVSGRARVHVVPVPGIRTTWTPPDGEPVEVGDVNEIAAILGVAPSTFIAYVNTGRPKHNPAPPAVTRDLATGRLLWDLAQVRAWQARRPGAGNRTSTGPRPRRT